MSKTSKKNYIRVAISDEAYAKLRELAKQPEFHTKGAVGVLDKMLLGRFTTVGSGRPFGPKKSKNPEEKA